MSRNKYRMTDAAAKRITTRLAEEFKPGSMYIGIEQVEALLREEDFSRNWKGSYVSDLVQWWVENGYPHYANLVTQRYIREYYEQQDGITSIKDGLMKVGIIPYPEDD